MLAPLAVGPDRIETGYLTTHEMLVADSDTPAPTPLYEPPNELNREKYR
jgi:hypothetical protein